METHDHAIAHLMSAMAQNASSSMGQFKGSTNVTHVSIVRYSEQTLRLVPRLARHVHGRALALTGTCDPADHPGNDWMALQPPQGVMNFQENISASLEQSHP